MKSVVMVFLTICSIAVHAQSPSYRPVRGENPLQDRNTYLLTLLESTAAVRALLANDDQLRAIGRRLVETRDTVYSRCDTTPICRVDPMMLSENEIAQIADVLERLTKEKATMDSLVQEHLRPSGMFQKHAALEAPELIRVAWVEAASAVNRLYRVYGVEQSYKVGSDGPSYGPSLESPDRLQAALAAEIDNTASEAFFSPWSRLGFDLLIVNQRDEAVRYEPLDEGENRQAQIRARSLKWTQWRYTAIVIPGSGLNSGETGVSPTGEFMVRMAARRWREGLAPFILVSGGHVHPNRTPFAEALEMKRILGSKLAVPENAILVDPYARHTTTNLRNAVRLLFHLGAPMDRPFLVTNHWVVRALQAPAFRERCMKELGYQPAEIGEATSRFDVIALPNIMSLNVDPQDPLDP